MSPLVSTNLPPRKEDSEEELTKQDGGDSGEDGIDDQEDADDGQDPEAGADDAGEDDGQEEDPETLRKRLKDTQAALTRAQQELKAKSTEPAPKKAAAGTLDEARINELYERNRSDERFLENNPEIRRQQEAIRALRAAQYPNSTLEEVAVRFSFIDKAKLDAARSRKERGTNAAADDDNVPNPIKDKVAYKKWRAKNLSGSSRLRSV